MGPGKRRELLAAGLGGRAAGTLAMFSAEVLREILGIVFLELAVVVAEEADFPQPRVGGLARVRPPLK